MAAFRELGVPVADCNLHERLDLYGAHPLLTPEQAIQLTNNSLHAACYQYAPDVLFVTSCMYLTAGHLDTIRARGTRIVILHTESPYEDDTQIQRAAHADVNLINDPTHLDAFRKVSPSSWYVPHAYRPDRHHPRQAASADHESDFCFVGTGFPSRVAFLERVDWAGIDVAIGGHWKDLDSGSPLRKYLAHDPEECLPNTQTAELYAGTKASANWYRREAHLPHLAFGWAMSPREIELAAMGVFFLREARAEGDLILPMVPTFTGPEDFGEKLRWWLAHDDERAEVAAQAREAIAARTFVNHAKLLMRVLGA